MPGKAVGRAAVGLAVALPEHRQPDRARRRPGDRARPVGRRPGACASFCSASPSLRPSPITSGSPRRASLGALLPETAAAYLAATEAGVLPDSSFALGRVRLGRISRRGDRRGTRERTRLRPGAGRRDGRRASPRSGWYAVAAVDPFDAADPLADPRFARPSAGSSSGRLGPRSRGHRPPARGRWRLPSWVATTIGHLNLPLGCAGTSSPNRDLFAVVQLAVLEAETRRASRSG